MTTSQLSCARRPTRLQRPPHKTFVMSLLAALLSAALLAAPGHCTLPSGFGRKKDPVPSIKTDVKFIRCDACQHIAKAAHRSVAALRTAQPHWKPLTEEAIIEHLEQMCNPQGEQGEWILHLDVQEDGDKLKVVEMSGVCTSRARLPSPASYGAMGAPGSFT